MDIDNIENFYMRVSDIGKGYFGVVYKALNRNNGSYVAIKSLRITFFSEDMETNFDKLYHNILYDINTLNDLKHKNIVTLVEVIKNFDGIFFVFEYLPMNLTKYLKEVLAKDELIDFALAKSYLYQINNAVMYCHDNYYLVHRDIKPSNLLITADGLIKLTDFWSDSPRKATTPCYRSPEMLTSDPLTSFPTDVWSMGCVFAEMIVKEILFEITGTDHNEQLLTIFRILGKPPGDIWTGKKPVRKLKRPFPDYSFRRLDDYMIDLDRVGFDLLDSMLIFDPAQRITTSQIKDDPYFKDVDLNTKPKFFENN